MKKFGVIVALTTIFYVIFYLFFPVIFEDNDDVVMLMISSGALTGSPDEHLVFQHIFIGYILKFLYLLSPNVEWYSLHLIVAQITALSIIIFVFLELKQFENKIILIASLIGLLTFATFFILRVQFTTTAFLLAGAGFLLLKYIFSNENIQLNKCIIACFMLLWSSMIRFEPLIISSIILAPFFIVNLKDIKFLKTSSLYVVVILLSYAFNHLVYNANEAWSFHKKFNNSRVSAYDNNQVKHIDYGYITNNSKLSKEAVMLFNYYSFPIKDVNFSNLKIISQAVPKKSLLSIEFSIIKGNISAYLKELVFLFFIIFGLLFIKPIQYQIILSIFIFFGIFIFLGLNNIPKPRVFFGLLYIIFLFITYCLLKTNLNGSIYQYTLLIFLCSFQTLFFSYRFYVFFKQNKKSNTELMNQIACLDEKKVYISFIETIQMQSTYPLSVTKTFKDKRIIFTGWLMNSPIYQKQIEVYFGEKYKSKEMHLIEKIIPENTQSIRFMGEIPAMMKAYLEKNKINYQEDNKLCKTYKFEPLNK